MERLAGAEGTRALSRSPRVNARLRASSPAGRSGGCARPATPLGGGLRQRRQPARASPRAVD